MVPRRFLLRPYLLLMRKEVRLDVDLENKFGDDTINFLLDREPTPAGPRDGAVHGRSCLMGRPTKRR